MQMRTAQGEMDLLRSKVEQREARLADTQRRLQSTETLVETLESKEMTLNREIENLKAS